MQEGSGDLKRHIGLVWQGCDATAKAALDNKGAIFKGLAGVMAVLKDTLREVRHTSTVAQHLCLLVLSLFFLLLYASASCKLASDMAGMKRSASIKLVVACASLP